MPGVYIPFATIKEAQEIQDTLIGEGTPATLVGDNPPAYKKLPRLADGQFCMSFKTEAHTYTILPPGEGIGFDRYGELFDKLMFVQTGVRSYDELKAKAEQFMADLVGVAKGGENKAVVWSIQRISEIMEATKEMERWRYDVTDYLATIFIVREGEDLSTWSRAMAESKIADWDKEGYDRNDFFLLTMPLSRQFLQDRRELAETLNREVYPDRHPLTQNN